MGEVVMPIQTTTYTEAQVLPLYDPQFEARELPINLASSTTFAKGSLLALVDGQNEIQTITGSTAITGGTYKINVDGRLTGSIAYNANAATATAAVEALLNVGAGNVVITGGALNTSTPFTVTWQGALAKTNMSAVTVVTSALTGSQTVTVATTQPGRSDACYVPYSSAVQAAPAVAFTATAAAGAAFPAGTYTVGYTYYNAAGESTLSGTQTVTTASGNLAIAVTAVTPLPAGITGVRWYVSTLAGSTDLALAATNNGSALTINTAPVPGAAKPPSTNTAYSQSAGTGAHIAKCILPYDLTTDADGKFSFGDGNLKSQVISAYFNGRFKTTDIPNLDAKAVADLQARIITGTLANGVILIPG